MIVDIAYIALGAGFMSGSLMASGLCMRYCRLEKQTSTYMRKRVTYLLTQLQKRDGQVKQLLGSSDATLHQKWLVKSLGSGITRYHDGFSYRYSVTGRWQGGRFMVNVPNGECMELPTAILSLADSKG